MSDGTPAPTQPADVSTTSGKSADFDGFPGLLQATTDVQWRTDADGRVTGASDGFLVAIGYEPPSVIGQTLPELGFRPLSAAAEAEIADRIAERQPLERVVLTGQDADGQDLWWQVSCVPVQDASGSFAGYAGAGIDVADFYLLQQELEEAELRLQALATTDPLTGAFNRHRFEEQAAIELARVRRYGKPLSLIMLDGDHFRQINDDYGHDAGDAVLQAIVDACRGALRQSDIVGRMDGEAFAILLPETTMDGAWETAERVRARVAAHRVPHGDEMVSFTVSLGVATSDGNDWHLGRLMASADRALHAAKAAGRNRVVTADTLRSAPSAWQQARGA